MKKILIYLAALIGITSCSPKISPYFKYNKIVKNKYTHIINDSIQTHIQLYGDYEPIVEEKDIRSSFKQKPYLRKKEILLYGINSVQPTVEVYLAIDEKPIKFERLPENVTVSDTAIDKHFLSFIKINTTETPFEKFRFGEDYTSDLPSVNDILQYTGHSNAYLKILSDINIVSVYEPENEWQNLQLQLTYASFLSENNKYYKENLRTLFKRLPLTINDSIVTVLNKQSITQNVLQHIANLAENEQILMLNENHFFPNDRLLLFDLLPLLKEKGFTHLALEALSENQEEQLNQHDAYPIQTTGFYIREQNFANVIRLAKELGFNLVAYESDADDRENGQADNLFKKTWAKNPTAKVVLWAGLSHIYEKKQSGKKYLATLLREKFNINPLTISQTQLVAYKGKMNAPYSLIDSAHLGPFKKVYTDFLLVNNRERKFSNTTTFKNIYNQEIQLSLFYKKEIDKKYDYVSRIPYFTTLLEKDVSANIPVQNNKEDYLLVITDKSGNVLDKRDY